MIWLIFRAERDSQPSSDVNTFLVIFLVGNHQTEARVRARQLQTDISQTAYLPDIFMGKILQKPGFRENYIWGIKIRKGSSWTGHMLTSSVRLAAFLNAFIILCPRSYSLNRPQLRDWSGLDIATPSYRTVNVLQLGVCSIYVLGWCQDKNINQRCIKWEFC